MDDKKLGDWIWQGTWLCLPLYPYFNNTTKQVYTRSIFREMTRLEISFKELKSMLNEYIKCRNKIFGCVWSNPEIYLIRENQKFEFGIFEEFNIYDDNSKLLGEFKININQPPTDKFNEWIEQITREYLDGIIHCSDCDKTIFKNEIAGRYFAGVYCDECWNGKWKAIESKENYD